MAITSPIQSHTEFAAAFNAGDLDALCDMYEADAVFVPEPGATPLRGIDAIRETLTAYLAMRGSMEIETVFTYENGDIALLRSRWRLTSSDRDGNPIVVGGNSTEVLRRQPGGEWRQIIDHPFGAS